MKPSRHVATSAVFSLGLSPWLGWRALLVFAGGVLLDLDRYVWYAIRFRTLRVGEAVERFQGRERIRGGPRFFHSVEFVAAVVIGGFFYRPMWPFALGVLFHVLLDLFVHKKRGRFWFYFDPAHLHSLVVDLVKEQGDKVRDRSVPPTDEDEE